MNAEAWRALQECGTGLANFVDVRTTQTQLVQGQTQALAAFPLATRVLVLAPGNGAAAERPPRGGRQRGTGLRPRPVRAR